MEFGNLATLVTGLELVTGEGNILLLSASNNPETFKAAQVCFVKHSTSGYMLPYYMYYPTHNIIVIAH